MKQIRIVAALIVTAVIVSAMASVAFAAPSLPSHGSFVNVGGVPEGSVLVLDVTLKVINDEDSGLAGYWAIDNYNRQIQVWQIPDGSFYAVAKYEGKWQTFAEVPSPGNTGTASKDASGTFHGGYVATFNGTLKADPTLSVNGNIGTFDYGGSKADVLKGTYSAGQTGPTNIFSWINTYFTGVSNFSQPNWGWTYNYKEQTWNNYDYGTTGDIVV